jgi:hypothetical protein
MSDTAALPRIAPLAQSFIAEKKLEGKAKEAFEAIFAFIGSTKNLDITDDNAMAPVLNYAQSIFEASRNINSRAYIGAYKKLVENVSLDEDNSRQLQNHGQNFASAIRDELADGNDTVGEVRDLAEIACNSQLSDTVFAGLKQYTRNFQMLREVASSLSGAEGSANEGEDAQLAITQFFRLAMQQAEQAKKAGQLSTETEVQAFITRRVQRMINEQNSSDRELKITGSDLKLFSKNMDSLLEKSGKDLSKPENKNDLMNFLAENKVWVFSLIAMLSQPLAKAFASLPFGIGTPFNFILAQVNNNLGPIVTAAITGSMLKEHPPIARDPQAQKQTAQAA